VIGLGLGVFLGLLILGLFIENGCAVIAKAMMYFADTIECVTVNVHHDGRGDA
jgi:hypothetical protein